MALRKSQIPSCVICCLLAAGCDPCRTSSQVVRLQIVDSPSGQPLEGKKVSLKYDYFTAAELLPPKHMEQVMSPEEWDEHMYRDALDGSVWHVSSTDGHGQADFDVEVISIDRTRGSKPPSWRNFVTGAPYLVRVEEGLLPEEELTVVMQPGASVKGKAYAVTVIDIQEPRYVDME